MIYLALSIFCSTLIVLLFKAFQQFRINSFQAIVFNYLTCAIIGLGYTNADQLGQIPYWNGLPYALCLGTLFIVLFYLMARTTQVIGVTVASVAQKLSFVVPVIAGILMFNESFTYLKLVGFMLAILSVLFISRTRNSKIGTKGHLWMPLVVFAGSGVCDLVIKVIEANHLGLIRKATFTVILFGTAFLIGFGWMLWGLIRNRKMPDAKSLLAGFLLGVPNYFSIYFLIAALQQSGWEASQVFPINNVGVILFSALMAWLIFREVLNRLQVLGLGLALTAIFILI
ncbi:MAG: EamA family transporter [Bacteroidetes bacterium]|nr:EamA family transporter [Bacteroidota bacterium]